MSYFSHWVQVVFIFFISTFKYGLGLFTAVNSNAGFWPTIIANLGGGAIGTLLFIYLGSFIKQKYISYRYKQKQPNRFSKWTRFLIQFKKKFGLIGISILSPIVLTIPVGVILALQITKNKLKIFFYIFTGCLLWSWVVFLIDYFIGIDIFK